MKINFSLKSFKDCLNNRWRFFFPTVFFASSLQSRSFLAPDAVPEIVGVGKKTSSSIELIIFKPEDNTTINGLLRNVIISYNSSYGKNESWYPVNHTDIFNGTELFSVTLDNLRPFTMYEIRVAYNTIATGNYSDSFYNSTTIESKKNPE